MLPQGCGKRGKVQGRQFDEEISAGRQLPREELEDRRLLHALVVVQQRADRLLDRGGIERADGVGEHHDLEAGAEYVAGRFDHAVFGGDFGDEQPSLVAITQPNGQVRIRKC